MSAFRDLIHEVHRRSLWQVLGIYLVGSWVALQVVDVLVDNFGLPAWFPAFALALLVIGLPIVLATAFVQEGAPVPGGGGAALDPPGEVAHEAEGPGGLTSSGAGGPEESPEGLHALLTWKNAILGGMAAFSVWGVVAAGWFLFGAGVPEGLGGAGGVPARSVAVLPFANMTGEDAHFSDGIHDDILTHLAGIDDLMVISRTSVLQYRETEKTIREVGQELGVSAILEGSVRKAGDRIRVNVQLIDARTDAHLWAEIYDRDLTPENIFAIQSEIARSIAGALKAELSAGEAAELAAQPTESMEAYDFYLRGQQYMERNDDAEELERAIGMFERALEQDPRFLEARAAVAVAHAQRYFWGHERTAEQAARALAAVERAEAIDPDHPRIRFARGWYHYHVEADYERALPIFEALLDENPSDARTAYSVGLLQRRLGRFDESTESLERARRLDPRSPSILRALTYNYIHGRRYPDAEEVLALRRELLPEDAGFNTSFLALTRLLANGDPAEVRATYAPLLEEPGEGISENATLPLYGAAWRVLPDSVRRAKVWERAEEMEVRVARGDTLPAYYYFRGTAQELDGLRAEAAASLDTARMEFETLAVARDEEETYRSRMTRAWLLADAERWDEAVREARAAASDPEAANDHIQARPMTRALLAHVLARSGGDAARDEAMDIVEEMATAERGWISVPGLRVDPFWDALRDHPRFRALVAAAGPATADR